MNNLVVIGGGYAATVLITQLRAFDYTNPIVWIMGESHLPYDRPYLSKEFLTNETVHEPPFLLTKEKLNELNIQLYQGLKANSIDRKTKSIKLENGTKVAYDRLVIATGGRAIKLPFPENVESHVSYIRELKEAKALKQQLKKCNSVLVVGGGWIGLEMAAASSKIGLKTYLVEKAPRLVARVLPEPVSAWLEEQHKKHGIEILKNNAIKNIEKEGKQLKVELQTGEALQVDHVVVGIGMRPNDAIAKAAGIGVNRGITTNVMGCTSDKFIYAIGDVANAFVSRYDQFMRMESWENGQWQATRLAQYFSGNEVTPMPVPWFWSDQYDLNIQIIGIGFSGKIIQRKLGENKWINFYLNEKNQITSCIGINAGKYIRTVRKLINKKTTVNIGLLNQQTVELEEALKT